MRPYLVCLALLTAWLSACGETSPPPEPSANNPESRAQANGIAPETPLVEPTEEEMRALEQAAIDALNASGGATIEMSGVRSAPIKIKLESFRKIGCKPYTRAFRCEAEIGTSYPDSNLPSETLPGSHRYQKDDQGRWTRD